MTCLWIPLLLLACAGPDDRTGDGGVPADGGSPSDGGSSTDGGTGDGGESGVPCTEIESPLSEVEVPVTFDEVWPVIQGWTPATITWQYSRVASVDVGSASAFSISIVQAGEPVAVQRTGGDPLDCRPGPELRIPVTGEVVIDGGSVVSAFEGDVDAQAAELPRIFFSHMDHGTATLSGAWTAEAAASLKEDHDVDLYGAELVAYLFSATRPDVWEPDWSLEAQGVREDGTHWYAGLLHGYPDP